MGKKITSKYSSQDQGQRRRLLNFELRPKQQWLKHILNENIEEPTINLNKNSEQERAKDLRRTSITFLRLMPTGEVS